MSAGTMYGKCERCGQNRPGPTPVGKAGQRRPAFMCSACLTLEARQKPKRKRAK